MFDIYTDLMGFLVQDMKETGPMDRETGFDAAFVVGNVKHDPTTIRLVSRHPVQRRAQGPNTGFAIQRSQDLKTNWLHHQTRSHRSRRVELVKHGDRKILLPQSDGQREAAYAAANNPDMAHLAYLSCLSLTIMYRMAQGRWQSVSNHLNATQGWLPHCQACRPVPARL